MRTLLLVCVITTCFGVVASYRHYRDDECTPQCGNILECCTGQGYDKGGYCHNGYAVCMNRGKDKTVKIGRRRPECDGRCSTVVECCNNDLGYDEGGYCHHEKAYCRIKIRD